jgi:uncharacterized membrane protein
MEKTNTNPSVHTNAIKTVADIKREFAPLVNINNIHKERLSPTDRAALFITEKIGTMGFFYFCVILAVIPIFFRPTIAFVQYASGFLQLILLPLILIGQNLQRRHAELRAESDYQTNTKAEKEIEAILLHLEKQDETMLEILRRIEKLEKAK